MIKIKLGYFFLGAILGFAVLLPMPKPSVSNFQFSFPRFGGIIRSISRQRKPTLQPIREALPTMRYLRRLSRLGKTIAPSQTPTVSPTVTGIPTATLTPTSGPSLTVSPTLAISPTTTLSPTSSPTPTEEPTLTVVPSLTPTEGPSLTPSPTEQITPSITPTTTPTLSPTITPTSAPPALVAYWKFEEGEGITTSDSSNNGYDLVLLGETPPLWETDVPPTSNIDTYSVFFTGNNYGRLVNSGDNSAFDFPTGFTMEAWIKTQSTDAGVLSKIDPPYGYMIWALNGKVVNYINGYQEASSTIINDGSWHHIAVTWDGSVRKVYVDGVEEASSLWTTPPTSSDKDFYLATYPIGGNPLGRNFIGSIDEVKIYNYARTGSQIIEDAAFAPPTAAATPSLTPTPTPLQTVVINELMWMGSSKSFRDEWIELRNMTASTIDLTNWKLEGAGESDAVLIIPSVTIASQDYFLISNFSRDDANSILDVNPDLVDENLQLDNSNLLVKLYDSAGSL